MSPNDASQPVIRPRGKLVYSLIAVACVLAIFVIGFGTNTDAFPIAPAVWMWIMAVLTVGWIVSGTAGWLLAESKQPSYTPLRQSSAAVLFAQFAIVGLGWGVAVFGGVQ